MRYLLAILPLTLLSAAALAGGAQAVPPAALAPVPEPMIWSMMIAGFGFAGAALRRSARRRGIYAHR